MFIKPNFPWKGGADFIFFLRVPGKGKWYLQEKYKYLRQIFIFMNFEIVTNIFIFSANVTTKVFLYNDPLLKKFKGSKKIAFKIPSLEKSPRTRIFSVNMQTL